MGCARGSYSLSTIPNQRGHSHTPGWDAVVPPLLRRVAQLQFSHVSADRDLLGQQWWSYLDCPQTPFRLQIRENHQLFDGKHSWKVSTLFQNLEATQHQVLRHQRFSLWTRPSPLYRAQSGLQIRAVLEGSTVFVLYLGSCLNLTSVQESKEQSRIV